MVMVGSGRKPVEVSVIWWLYIHCFPEQRTRATSTVTVLCKMVITEVGHLPEVSLLVLGRVGLHRGRLLPKEGVLSAGALQLRVGGAHVRTLNPAGWFWEGPLQKPLLWRDLLFIHGTPCFLSRCGMMC